LKYQLRTKNYNNEPLDLALNDLLIDRNIQQPFEWLHPNESYEYSPFRMNNMAKAVDILYSIIKNRDSNILVVVDSDMDGYTSGAIAMSLLYNIDRGQDIDYVLHPGKEHGLDLKDIPEDADLVIVPDASSSEKTLHLELLKKGTKIIILDHHEIENDFDYGEYNDNIAIVSSQIDYPNPALSGAGVTLKFVQAYSQTHGIILPKKLYALAACGIVADVMDMSYLENKQIVSEGVKYIKEHPFLMGLISKAHYNMENPEPSIKDIGWIIGPNINSIIRLGTQPQKHMIFKALVTPELLTFSSKKGCEDEEVPIFEEAIRLCDNAKKRQTNAVNKSIKIIEKNLEPDNHNVIIYVDEDQDLTFELSGLIANKLLSVTNKPVLLLRRYVDNKGTDEYRGSVRGKPVEGLLNLRDVLKNISGVTKAEGHAFACGIGITRDSFATFKTHLNTFLDKLDFNANLYLVDLISNYKTLNLDVANIMAADNIWCHGVDKPLCVLTDIPSNNYTIMGTDGQHLKLDCGKFDIVLFNEPKLTAKLSEGTKFNLDAVGEFDIDKAYNVGRLQFMVKEYQIKKYEAPSVWDMVF